MNKNQFMKNSFTLFFGRPSAAALLIVCTLLTLVSCGKGNNRDGLDIPRGSAPKAIEPPAELLPCDEASNKKAEDLKNHVTAGVTGGTISETDAAPLKRLASETQGCFAANVEFWNNERAKQNLERAKSRLEAGVATQLDVLKAEQIVLSAQYCQSSLANVAKQEEWVAKQIEAGVANPTGYAPMLRVRLEISQTCAI
jgi:hypothetical protein